LFAVPERREIIGLVAACKEDATHKQYFFYRWKIADNAPFYKNMWGRNIRISYDRIAKF
jgi:hypothetical protein